LRALPRSRRRLDLRQAAELIHAVVAAKTHTRTLYRKLDVSDRQDAVARGRELGLI